MLTERQLAVLRASEPTNRVATAISLLGVTQGAVAAAIGVTQAYVSDVARQRYSTITLANARKFARYFGCSIDDLFPPSRQRVDLDLKVLCRVSSTTSANVDGTLLRRSDTCIRFAVDWSFPTQVRLPSTSRRFAGQCACRVQRGS